MEATEAQMIPYSYFFAFHFILIVSKGVKKIIVSE